eukprot:m.330318 g.330318  ORF g.330318 m.330318 type:complete len:705 (-) comp65100_c0_seq1:28-2142(-)
MGITSRAHWFFFAFFCITAPFPPATMHCSVLLFLVWSCTVPLVAGGAAASTSSSSALGYMSATRARRAAAATGESLFAVRTYLSACFTLVPTAGAGVKLRPFDSNTDTNEVMSEHSAIPKDITCGTTSCVRLRACKAGTLSACKVFLECAAGDGCLEMRREYCDGLDRNMDNNNDGVIDIEQINVDNIAVDDGVIMVATDSKDANMQDLQLGMLKWKTQKKGGFKLTATKEFVHLPFGGVCFRAKPVSGSAKFKVSFIPKSAEGQARCNLRKRVVALFRHAKGEQEEKVDITRDVTFGPGSGQQGKHCTFSFEVDDTGFGLDRRGKAGMVGSCVYLGEPEKSCFAYQGPFTTTAKEAISVSAGDLDGDGDADALYVSYKGNTIGWSRNDGGGAFTSMTHITTSPKGPRWVTTADMDNDGDQDVVYASYNDGVVTWLRNDGGNVFTPQVPFTNTSYGSRCVVTADLDNDGDLDVVYASRDGNGDYDLSYAPSFDGTIGWSRNDGGGSFTTQVPITTTARGANAVFAADLDNDGDNDVVFTYQIENTVQWARNNGDGSFTVMPPFTTTADKVRAAIAADLDNDGDNDVIYASRDDNTIGWFRNNGGGSFTSMPPITTTTIGPNSIVAADVDGDMDLDIVFASYLDNTVGWMRNDGSKGFMRQPNIYTDAASPRSVFVTDLDGDGKQDVLFASYEDGTVAWARNESC